MASPKSKPQVQRQTGRVAALNRFISFYDTLRRNKKFEWYEECETTFKQLKHYLTTLPVLFKTIEGESLYLYIAVTATAISCFFINEGTCRPKPNLLCKFWKTPKAITAYGKTSARSRNVGIEIETIFLIACNLNSHHIPTSDNFA